MQNEYFKAALSDFAFEAANGGAIRHLAGKGCTVRQIMDRLDIPAPYEKVQTAVWDYFIKEGIVLLDEPGKAKEKQICVKEHGKFGKTSFRQVVIPKEAHSSVCWKESACGNLAKEEQADLLREKCRKNGRETSYASCDFGLFKKENPKRFAALLSGLDDRQKEYAEGLPWAFQRVYHRMDERMTEMICRLLRAGQYTGSCYFAELGEKITIE